jgi:hypothetical protein
MKSARKSPQLTIAILFTASIAILASATTAKAQRPASGAATQSQVTFTKDIAPILQEKCQACHRTGKIAPMSLMTYQETRPWARDIKQRVVMRTMPPWFMDKTVGIQHFENDNSLTDQQIATVVKWVDEGAPQGDPKDTPPPKAFADDGGWQLARVFAAFHRFQRISTAKSEKSPAKSVSA